MRIAYLTTEYPKVSHTFIRREIAEMERRGHQIVRLAVRPPSGPLLDPADRAEAEKTIACLSHSKVGLVAHAARWAASRPAGWWAAARTAHGLYARSERGFVRHAAYLAEAALLSSRLRAAGVSHVHVHFGTNAAAVALLMKKLAGITYSLTVHGPGEFDAPIGLSLREKVVESEFTVAISHYGRAQLCRWVGSEHWERIHVVRCTVNEQFLAPSPLENRLSNVFLCVGRLTPQKGQLILLDAFARANRQSPIGRLVFVGDGELRAAITARAATLGIEDRVEITGWLSEAQVRERILGARVVVLPSSAEGLPVVLMEALALGRPVVSTYTAGIPELVRAEENGWLIPSGDEQALAHALREAATTPWNELRRRGNEGRKLVLTQHHPAVEGDKLEALFQHYIAQRV